MKQKSVWKSNIKLTHLLMLFSSLHSVQPKTKKRCQEQTAHFRSAFVIIGVLGEEASASLFSKLMKLHSTDRTQE